MIQQDNFIDFAMSGIDLDLDLNASSRFLFLKSNFNSIFVRNFSTSIRISQNDEWQLHVEPKFHIDDLVIKSDKDFLNKIFKFFH